MAMKKSSRTLVFFLSYVIIAGGLWIASEWWEKGLAEKSSGPHVSPGGCYRVDIFKPFWVLPMMFHRESDPNEDQPPTWFPWWGYPAFFRLYDHRTGVLISETKIYDLESAGDKLSWGSGSGVVMSGLILIGPNLPDCMGDRPTRVKPQ
ncbi:hypothetical protein DND58_00540 [Pseudomonas syringae pv. pisi]|nr:hypothetical protein N032_09340 [Pseudomonas syringae pv. pisi str. PP1]PYD12143.1 hypothetical protein DND62_15120 [Pseudomonas syringae pv. pisi]PYD34143.1 hypothetical protein DND58_00540 [Pseudomonas syringae pv. pisi]PYD35618.1 hypothetical protein DND67_02830 [Pseudomonas syringae pv. pisi]